MKKATATTPLTPRQRRFCEEYLTDCCATQAAIRAGYSKVRAGMTGHDLLKRPHVSAEIKRLMDARSERTGITADYVLGTIVDTVERCKQAEAVRDREGSETGEYVFDARSVLKGCELLGKHLGLFEKDNAQKAPVIVIPGGLEET